YADDDILAFRRRRTQDDPFSVIRQKLIAFWVLARFPWRFQFALLGVLYMMVFGRVVYNAPLYNVPLLIAAFVIICLINAGGCAINDYFDRHADAISKPERPIPAGNVSAAGALEYAAVTFVIGAAVALYLNLLAFVIVVFEILFLVMYPSVFKRLSGLGANFLMGLAAGFIAVFGEALLLGHISYLSLSFVPMIIAGGMSANAFKDIVTVEGDKKNGYTTVAVKRGVRAAVAVVVAVSVLALFFNYIPYVLGVVGIAYAIVVTISAFARLYEIQSLIRKPTVANVRSLMWTMSFFAFVPIALLAGAFL
ncbi:MAG TPA: UbiA family prenyltransferase, partial [Candidatus Bathyarchaeia archaeon]|nr:UbiA family prenyltransferase [Candidatus Bathyarchaeia archaeon]